MSRDFFTRNAIGPRRMGAKWNHADALNRTARPPSSAAWESAFARSFLGGRPNLRAYCPWSQKPELVRHLENRGIVPIAYSSLVPLSTWRSAPGHDSAKTDAMRSGSQDVDSPFKALAQKYGVSEAQVLLCWGVQKGYAVLPKSTNPDRLRQNADIFSFEIELGDMAAIETMDRGDGVAWSVGDLTKAA